MDWCDITESKFGSDDTGGTAEIVTATLRLSGEKDGEDDDAAAIWGQYGFTSRPAAPDGEKTCQALAITVGGERCCIATRDLRGAEAHGALNPGDVAVWSAGKNSVRCNMDRSISIHQAGEGADGKDAGISVEKDGTIIFYNQYGQFELGKEGLQAFLATGEAMKLGGGYFQTISPQAFIMAGFVGLGPAPSKPIATGVGAAVAIPYLMACWLPLVIWLLSR